ncbi:helix-turn-helix domain-containing protein [Natrinema longum]|uniref:MarR family transcriptional regulator n=1 Tax=Natrinema longum TaxID=370324 RepID=A0A8A2UDF1_9EURY|nr:helix-turn-helix domain-containing protein [Natrinema longum]MBZ6495364.1 MarR family transcriptional regulator [Natrinema longum]QSW86663.1 MarR family transcriptional regulator [Natrinema longum]
MMKHDARTTDRLGHVPAELGSAQSKLVYLTLEATGGATATDLSELLAMRKLSVLSVLSSLESEELIERTESEYVVAN